MSRNIDKKTVESFGSEWKKFDQTKNYKDLKEVFDRYFKIFPWDKVNKNSIGFDMGCGSGRWAEFVLPYIGKLYCIDPSVEALNVARLRLKKNNKCVFIHSSANEFINEVNFNFDFGYSIGVLHHVPDTLEAVKACSKKLKSGAPFLIYLYYNFENRSFFFILLWKFSNIVRKLISRLPFFIKKTITDLIALFIYLPLKIIYNVLEKIGFKKVNNLPLSFYRNKSFYTIRTDSLDRFGTRLEKRFSKIDIINILEESNFEKIIFSDTEPYWTVTCIKK